MMFSSGLPNTKISGIARSLEQGKGQMLMLKKNISWGFLNFHFVYIIYASIFASFYMFCDAILWNHIISGVREVVTYLLAM